MAFTPHFKRKRKNCKEFAKLAPFPLCAKDLRYHGVFSGFNVELVDAPDNQIRALHDNGCYGKGSESRGGPISDHNDETLLLGLEEACLLAYFLKVLEIRDISGNELSWKSYLQAVLEYDNQFINKLAAYLYLKSKNWIIKSGIKFGGDFLIYKRGPRQYHASFLVLVQTMDDKMHSDYANNNLKGLLRLAETSDKDVLVLKVTHPSNFEITHATPETLRSLTIEETVIRRFNYTSFVQSKQ